MKTSRTATLALFVALLAMVVALGGAATALPGKGSVKANDIAKNAVRSKAVKNNSLTGNDIKESTLGKVPSATAADTAANGALRVSYRAAAGTGVQTIFNAGGLVIKATCLNATDISITMESLVDNAAVFAESHDHDGSGNSNGDTSNSDEQQGDFDAGQPVAIDGANLHADDGQGLEINYSNPDGTEVFVKLHNWLASGVASAPAACFVGGVGFVA